MKITKEMFKGFEGLEELKKMKETKCCSEITCRKCPLDKHNLNNSIECIDIVNLNAYAEKDTEEKKNMNKLIDIFTKENINSVLSELAPNRNLKYNDYVVYDNETFKIKGVVKSKSTNLIILNGYDIDRAPTYESCIVSRKAMKKGYTLWVEPSEIFALNDTVTKSNIEYKIVAISTPDYPILLNDHGESFININDYEDVFSSIPEAYERNYNKWVSSYDIKHK